jgi:Na+-transporting NADH:ubiquinone oxidoreductase subunit NqrF
MTQVIHRDYDDFKFLSLILYLTDVDESNGPHVFYPGTHKKETPEGVSPLVITGPAGTSFMADTYAFHQGKPLQSGRRLAFWARYGLYKNWIYDHDAAGTVPRSVVHDRIQWTEKLRYITRLLFED